MKTIGVITKTSGFEGAVVIRADSGKISEPKQGEPVFIVMDGIPVPFFTREAFLSSPDTLVISFDDYFTDRSVLMFKGCEVRTGESEHDGDDDDIDLTGFQLKDRQSGFVGVITSVTETAGQIVATVRNETGEVLIPLHPDLIIKTDIKRRIIFMSLPEGLTGIND